MGRWSRILLLLLICLSSGLERQGPAQLLAPRSASATLVQSNVPIVELELGRSTQGRPITALRIGTGERALWLIGDTHGLPEANTYHLVQGLAEHFRAHPEEVPPDVRLYLVPTLNPDGLELGTRFNARGVDLNRNMDTSYDACAENDWQPVVQGAYGIVSETGGPAPESEIESALLREVVLGASAIIFYHSDGGVVFPAFCEHAPSIALGEAYAQAAGYRYTRFWEHYLITGGMHDWAAGLGIASITPELSTGVAVDLEQNLAGVRAVLSRAAELLPLPTPVQDPAGVEVPALLWRYWRSHAGPRVFGSPISPALEEGGALVQYFEHARIEVRPELLESGKAFSWRPDGRRQWTERLLDAPASPVQPN